MSSFSEHANIVPSNFDDGWLLDIGGDVQSHVDLTDPSVLRFEYLHRIGNVLDLSWPPAQPIRVLHLGAGALTLPRYLQATRPGSQQTVVELNPELVSLVLAELPLPSGTQLEVITGDARTEVAGLQDRTFDAIVVDIFTGEDTAPHLTGADFYRELIDRLAPSGVLLVNVGEEEEGVGFIASQACALHSVAETLGGAWILSDASTLAHRSAGNAVLAASGGFATDADARAAFRSRLAAAGPHPAAVLTPSDTALLLKNLES